MVTYLQKRDETRAELAVPKPPRWTDTTPVLAAQVYDIHKSSLPQAPHKVKLIKDKLGTRITKQKQHIQQNTTTSSPPVRYARRTFTTYNTIPRVKSP